MHCHKAENNTAHEKFISLIVLIYFFLSENQCNLPEKNWVMSALVQLKGRPLSRTTQLVWTAFFRMTSASLFVTSYTVITQRAGHEHLLPVNHDGVIMVSMTKTLSLKLKQLSGIQLQPLAPFTPWT